MHNNDTVTTTCQKIHKETTVYVVKNLRFLYKYFKIFMRKWILSCNTFKIKCLIENKLMVTKGERGWGRDNVGVWD